MRVRAEQLLHSPYWVMNYFPRAYLLCWNLLLTRPTKGPELLQQAAAQLQDGFFVRRRIVVLSQKHQNGSMPVLRHFRRRAGPRTRHEGKLCTKPRDTPEARRARQNPERAELSATPEA